MRYRFYTADVFTETKFGGNQLAVFPQAQGLQDDVMQKIAREFNFSETVFVFPPKNPEHTRCVRIFTPACELPFAGHPTVGTAHVLAATREIPGQSNRVQIVFEEGVGPVRVEIEFRGSIPMSAQFTTAKLPEMGPPPPSDADLARVLSLQPEDLLEKGAVSAWSCGVPYLFVPLKGLDAIRRSSIDMIAWKEIVANYWAVDVYVFTYETELEGASIHSRMFAPAFGIAEDPATGSAAAALGGYLAGKEKDDGTFRWTIEQGIEMDRPSILNLEVDKKNGRITAVRVGGSSVMVTEGYLEL
jgi:trans-2,3-dihydro-3-hydroxyanthranilate isomerase